jgi:hypothetical protein
MIIKFDYNKAFGDVSKKESYSLVRDTWFNNGWNEPTQSKINFKDLMATPQAAYWMPKVVEEIVREPVEPMLIVSSLLDRIAYTAAARITFPALGALVAYDIPEAGAYPEQTLQVSPGSITINVGKTGVAFKITEEMQTHSQYDLMNMHIRAARRALDRHKEKKGMDFISALGVTLFDNIKPQESMFGTCTGRAITGSGNGSCRMEDLLKAYAHVMMQGYTPDTILLHPLAWSMWMADPLLQTIVKNTGNGQWFQPHNMPKSGLPWAASSQGGQGMAGGYGAYTAPGNAASETPTGAAGLDQNLNTPAMIPSYFPHPLRVLVSPFVPYNEANNTCDIMICDSANLGAIVVEHDVVMDQWEDMATDVIKVKLKERYAFTGYADGLSSGVLRNVPIRANEIALPVQATISSAGSIAELDVTTAISGL